MKLNAKNLFPKMNSLDPKNFNCYKVIELEIKSAFSPFLRPSLKKDNLLEVFLNYFFLETQFLNR